MPKETTKLIETKPIEPGPAPEEAIRIRAFQLYEARGREEGHDLEDWFRAEAEITPKAA